MIGAATVPPLLTRTYRPPRGGSNSGTTTPSTTVPNEMFCPFFWVIYLSRNCYFILVLFITKLFILFAGRWFMGMAIANLGYVANAWVYLIDRYN
jgi:hypothetical protein